MYLTIGFWVAFILIMMFYVAIVFRKDFREYVYSEIENTLIGELLSKDVIWNEDSSIVKLAGASIFLGLLIILLIILATMVIMMIYPIIIIGLFSAYIAKKLINKKSKSN